MKTAAFIVFLTVIMAVISAQRIPDNGENWTEYNGNGDRSHYSPLTQINAQNVSQLKVAWTYAVSYTHLDVYKRQLHPRITKR